MNHRRLVLAAAAACALLGCKLDPGKVLEDDMFGCNDGIDEDGDGLTDCADPDCALFCPGACGNGDCEPASGESCASCPADCTSCACTTDGSCDWYAGETCGGCAADCSCGAGDCNAFFNCLGNCTDGPCTVACWEGTCIMGQMQYLAVEDCQAAMCAADCDPVTGTQSACQMCTMSSCNGELTQCILSGC